MKNMFFLPFFLLAIFIFQSSAAITETGGWLETFYVKWEKNGACVAKVSYRATGTAQWTQIDDQLIREYGDHFRADVLGLAAGTYEVQVIPVNGGVDGTPMTSTGIVVSAHDRSGFAFMGGVVPGAYSADGTLKTNAEVIYITDQNKETVSFPVKTASNGNTTASTGLQAIIKNLEKGYENRPIAIRFIGKITDDNLTLDANGGDIGIKDNAKNTANFLTLEGVGDDAVLYGFGIKTARAENLEIRNLGFMLTNADEGDNVGINTNSKHIWIHNNDMFYGNPGSDADQVKGDGATDVKASTNVTISYNHYWDNGKTHLIGNSSSETPGYITIHHNWYDHSDSRHPRVRLHYVHVYNNYYDGVATYGVGAVMSSSIFAERNYFYNTNRPLLISMQGNGGTTFSSEDGGMIKAFENWRDNSTPYSPWSSSNNVEFDAYEVTSANTAVPSSVTAKKGGGTFKNDMIPANYPSYTSENSFAAVRDTVKKYAGRYWGGDFKYTITATNTSIDPTLKTNLQNYASSLIKVGTTGNASCPITSPSSSSAGAYSSSSAAPSSSSATPSSSSVMLSSSSVTQSSSSVDICTGTEKFWNFSDIAFSSELPEDISQSYTIDGLTILYGSNDMGYDDNSKAIDGYNFTHRFKFGGKGSVTDRALKFDVSGECSITVYGMSANASNIRPLALSTGTTELQSIDFPGNAISKGVYSYTGGTASLYLYSKNSGINIYGIKVNYCGNTPIAAMPRVANNNALSVMQSSINLQIDGNATVQIFDLKGNIVRTLKYEQGGHIISLGDLPQGLYFVKANASSWQKTAKVIVTKD